MHIQALPSEILLLVFTHVPVRELLCRVTLVCRQFRDLLQSRWYWSSRYQQLVGGAPTLAHADEMRLWQSGCVQAGFLLGLGGGGRGARLQHALITSAQGGVDCVHLMHPEVSGASLLVAAGSRDSTVYVWRKRMGGGGGGGEGEEGEGEEGEGGRGRQMRSFTGAALRGHRGWVWSVASEPSRPTLLCSGGWDHTVRMWDVTAGQEIAAVTGHHKAAVLCLAFATPDTLITACYDKTVRTFDIRTPISMTSCHKEHRKPVLSLAATDRYIYSGSEDKTLCVWDCRANQLMQTLKLESLVVSLHHHSDTLSCAGNKTVHLYNCPSGQLEEASCFTPDHSKHITSVHHNLAMVVTTSKDGTARIHSIGSGHKCLATLDSHTSDVTAVDFSRNTLALASSDRRVSLWRSNVY